MLSDKEELLTTLQKIDALVSQLELSGDEGYASVGPALLTHVQLANNLSQLGNGAELLRSNGASRTLGRCVRVSAAIERAVPVVNAAVSALVQLVNADIAEKLVQDGTFDALVDVSLRASSSADTVAVVLKLVDVMTTLRPACARLLIASGAVPKLMAIAVRHPLRDDVLLSAIHCIENLAISAASITSMFATRGHVLTVDGTTSFVDHASNVTDSLRAMTRVCSTSGEANALLDVGAVSAVFGVLRRHPKSGRVTRAALKALTRLAADSGAADEMLQKGVHLCVSELLHLHMHDAAIVIDAVEAISAMLRTERDDELEGIDAFGESFVVQFEEIALLHNSNRDVQQVIEPLLRQLRRFSLTVDEETLSEPKSLRSLVELSDALQTHKTEDEREKLFERIASSLQREKTAATYLCERGALEFVSELLLHSAPSDKLRFRAVARTLHDLADADTDAERLQHDDVVNALVMEAQSALDGDDEVLDAFETSRLLDLLTRTANANSDVTLTLSQLGPTLMKQLLSEDLHVPDVSLPLPSLHPSLSSSCRRTSPRWRVYLASSPTATRPSTAP